MSSIATYRHIELHTLLEECGPFEDLQWSCTRMQAINMSIAHMPVNKTLLEKFSKNLKDEAQIRVQSCNQQ